MFNLSWCVGAELDADRPGHARHRVDHVAIVDHLDAAIGGRGDLDRPIRIPGYRQVGVVDGDDLHEWQRANGIGTGGLSAKFLASADADANGAVDGRDFLVWQQNVGPSASGATVSEPPGGVLLAAAAALSGWRRVSRRR